MQEGMSIGGVDPCRVGHLLLYGECGEYAECAGLK